MDSISTQPYNEKVSEKFLDYCKQEVDVLHSKIKIAEDRARTNATVAGAVIPILGLIKAESPDVLHKVLIVYMVLALVAVMWLYINIMKGRKSHSTDDSWFATTQNEVYNGRIPHDVMMFQLQENWISERIDMGKIREIKYDLVEKQIQALVFLYASLLVYVVHGIL